MLILLRLAIIFICTVVVISSAAVAADEMTPSAAAIREHLDAHGDLAVELVASVPLQGATREVQRVAELSLQEGFDQLTRDGVDPARISLRLAEVKAAANRIQVNYLPVGQRHDAASVAQASPVVGAEGQKVSFHFEHGATSFKESEAPLLSGLIAQLLADGGAKVTIQGFADATGTEEQNRTVLRLRSLKISEQLVRSGVAPQRIQVLPGGKLGAKTDSAKVREEYRRVDVSTEPGPLPAPASAESEPAPTEAPAATPAIAPAAVPAPVGDGVESRWILGLGVGVAFPLANLQDSFGRGLASRLYLARSLASLPDVEVGASIGLTRFSRDDSDQANSLKQAVVLAHTSIKLTSPFESVTPAFGAGLGGTFWQARSEEKATGRKQNSTGQDLAAEVSLSLQRAVAGGAVVELRLPFHKSFGEFGSQYLALTLGGALEL